MTIWAEGTVKDYSDLISIPYLQEIIHSRWSLTEVVREVRNSNGKVGPRNVFPLFTQTAGFPTDGRI